MFLLQLFSTNKHIFDLRERTQGPAKRGSQGEDNAKVRGDNAITAAIPVNFSALKFKLVAKQSCKLFLLIGNGLAKGSNALQHGQVQSGCRSFNNVFLVSFGCTNHDDKLPRY